MENMATSVINISRDVNKINARMDAMFSKVENLIINEGNSANIIHLEVQMG